MMYVGFPILSLIYVFFFLTNYYSKKRINLFENKIVSTLMITNAIGLILELGCYAVMLIFKNPDTDTGMLVFKTYIYYMYVFDWILTGYICLLTNKKDELDEYDKKKYFFKKLLIFSPVIIIGFIVTFFTKLNYNDVYPKYYTYGLSTDFLVYFTCFLAPFWIYRCINTSIFKKSKEYTIRVGMVLFGIILVGISGALMQLVDRSMLIITSAHTLMLVLIYFTIENPDMKIVEEVHKAKEISDNANEEKAVFLYNMTNEIRDITKDINVNAGNILEETSNKKINVENINDSARNIQESTAMFTTITNEILDVSSIDSASIKIYNDKYNVNLIIKELMQTYKTKCNKKNLEFRSNIQSDLPNYLYGDSVGFKTVLTTILDNSVKYTEEGYIGLDISFIKKQDVVRLVINIEDSGIGIRANELKKVFADNNDTEEKDKLNLSSTLLNAKKLVTLMGGTLIPKSSFGSGTSMKIILDQRIAPDDGNLSKYEKEYDKKKLLLVANDETSKEISKLLKDEDIILEIIHTGKECLDKIREKEDYDLILLEEEITPLDGIKVMEKLMDIRSFNVNVILLSNKEYEEKEYTKLGFSYVITKPIPENIIDIINKY